MRRSKNRRKLYSMFENNFQQWDVDGWKNLFLINNVWIIAVLKDLVEKRENSS